MMVAHGGGGSGSLQAAGARSRRRRRSPSSVPVPERRPIVVARSTPQGSAAGAALPLLLLPAKRKLIQ
jgi:hypothetical protein